MIMFENLGLNDIGTYCRDYGYALNNFMINTAAVGEYQIYFKFYTEARIISEKIVEAKIIICGEEEIIITPPCTIRLNKIYISEFGGTQTYVMSELFTLFPASYHFDDTECPI